MVIGSRFIGNVGYLSTPLRRVGIVWLSTLIMLCCGVRVKDVTSGCRAVGRKLIESYAKTYPCDYPEPVSIIQASQTAPR